MTLGVIMLDTTFRRFPGDIGDPGSHPPGTLFERVPGATARRVVGGVASLTDPAARAEALEPFVAAGRRLIARGATALTTSCGFLVAYQRELVDALPVPVLTSALCLLPSVARDLQDGGRIGVLTFDAASLGRMHFDAARFSGEVAIAGLSADSVFRRAVLAGDPADSLAARELDVLDATGRLRAAEPRLAAVVLECTNFPPHREAITAMLGVPIFDIWDVVRLLSDQRPAT
jgi:hypothetical protein